MTGAEIYFKCEYSSKKTSAPGLPNPTRTKTSIDTLHIGEYIRRAERLAYAPTGIFERVRKLSAPPVVLNNMIPDRDHGWLSSGRCSSSVVSLVCLSRLCYASRFSMRVGNYGDDRCEIRRNYDKLRPLNRSPCRNRRGDSANSRTPVAEYF